MQKRDTKKITFQDMKGWTEETFEGVYEALHRTFEIVLKNPHSCSEDVRDSLEEISKVFFKTLPQTTADLRDFFEKFFEPRSMGKEIKGFYTAYYEIALQGSCRKSDRYSVPLYKKPEDLLFIDDLGSFSPELKGTRWAGRRKEDGQVHPYYTREEIMKGALQDPPFLWLEDPIAAYFLHIQGSGLVYLESGDVLRVGYGASNGYPYVSLGRVLKESQKIKAENLTKESLETYLRGLSPEVLARTLALNPSYIFFEEIKGLGERDGPRGTFGKPDQGVSLTPLRSLAVDPLYIPLGLPVWIQIFDLNSPLFPRLMMAQDTGSAIKGPKRGDIFWGTGDEAGENAGCIKNAGDMVILWPKKLPFR